QFVQYLHCAIFSSISTKPIVGAFFKDGERWICIICLEELEEQKRSKDKL
ncbi:unnamed protein product, partial [marine sediment metagenome]